MGEWPVKNRLEAPGEKDNTKNNRGKTTEGGNDPVNQTAVQQKNGFGCFVTHPTYDALDCVGEIWCPIRVC